MSSPTTSPPTITGVSHIDLTVTDLDRSEAFYRELLGATRLLDGRNDANHFNSRYVLHPDSLLVIGLVQHDEPAAASFDEHRVGLDHLAFNVATRDELDAWLARLDELGIEHSGIAEEEPWDVLVFRDPDNIQLELFLLKADPAALVPPPS